MQLSIFEEEEYVINLYFPIKALQTYTCIKKRRKGVYIKMTEIYILQTSSDILGRILNL